MAHQQAQDDLDGFNAVHRLRLERKANKRRRLQLGGVMKASEARAATEQRIEDDLAILKRKTAYAEQADYRHRLATIRRIWQPRYELRGMKSAFRGNIVNHMCVIDEIRAFEWA
ncbi:hypothetical protein CLAFUW4_12202 [Fulvia fulva]|uniref:Uncharacterized protein n=1 Tax=Passalora fulva TaxID=5499 RepID=A0A9Q8PF20_PASFU|nr:uncharacterized protein CLAFUR5_11234 [Fulvia fulva]KAK4618318.1 hypothetical protein CLAFUR4_12207 [Fulvia fulva]KAK4619129.1 hypothetical protein CLAFUR0_12218 [Fulvia fulva]UJO21270.1 hypothetical protein CLAFUR5_11234 [Fulvia fulva]WPV18690.1 hypothetical protein CLAFUW4_12202 [Fulvia fulva]WPV33122.1 hypothetical protein CLAFUW7_12209 [Fulvia fulva]